MANNRKNKVRIDGKRIQIVYSKPQRILKENYLTPKGKRLLDNGEITKEEAWEKYGKNRYEDNPNAKPIGTIIHNN